MRILVSLLALSLAAFAQEAAAPEIANHATEAQVRQLYQVLHVEDRMHQMLQLMSVQAEKLTDEALASSGSAATEKDKQFFNSLRNEELHKIMNPEFMAQMLEAMIPAYEKHISSEDIDQMIAFYSSPSGARILKAQPAMMQDGMAAAMPLIQAHMQEIMKDEQTRIAAYQQKNGPAASQSTKTPS